MSSELKWLYTFFIFLALLSYSTTLINDYWKHQLAIEAVKVGLSQDKNGNWTKQNTVEINK